MLAHQNKQARCLVKVLLRMLQKNVHSRLRSTGTQINGNQLSEKLRKWKVLFYGTDSFSEVALKALNLNRLSGDEQQLVQDIDVVCSEANCCVQRYAESESLCVHSWPYRVPLDTYDIGIVVSFGHLIPSKSILACKYGMINSHPSILPKWRGAAPIFHTILNGDIETGVTIIQVAPKKFDVGNIVMQQRYLVPPRFTSGQLFTMMASISANMVLNTLKDLPLLIENSCPQPSEGATHAYKILPSMGHVNWYESSPYDVDRKMRAFKDYIKVYTFWKNLKVILLDAMCPEEVSQIKLSGLVQDDVLPGFLYFHKKRNVLFVKCKDGWAGIRLVSMPKTGEITAKDLYNGYLSKVPSNQCFFLSGTDEDDQQ